MAEIHVEATVILESPNSLENASSGGAKKFEKRPRIKKQLLKQVSPGTTSKFSVFLKTAKSKKKSHEKRPKTAHKAERTGLRPPRSDQKVARLGLRPATKFLPLPVLGETGKLAKPTT